MRSISSAEAMETTFGLTLSTKEANMDEERLAERLYNLIPMWDREDGTVSDVLKQLKENPQDIIEYLLDYIDGLY